MRQKFNELLNPVVEQIRSEVTGVALSSVVKCYCNTVHKQSKQTAWRRCLQRLAKDDVRFYPFIKSNAPVRIIKYVLNSIFQRFSINPAGFEYTYPLRLYNTDAGIRVLAIQRMIRVCSEEIGEIINKISAHKVQLDSREDVIKWLADLKLSSSYRNTHCYELVFGRNDTECTWLAQTLYLLHRDSCDDLYTFEKIRGGEVYVKFSNLAGEENVVVGFKGSWQIGPMSDTIPEHTAIMEFEVDGISQLLKVEARLKKGKQRYEPTKWYIL
jgi:hypothetical protein